MIRTIFYIFVFFLLSIANVFSEIIKDFRIEGNQRVSESTIINFSQVKVNTDLNPNQFNKVLKNIYSTNFFEDVSLSLDDGILVIKVKEYPIVQSIIINGVKAKKFKEEIYEKITLKEKNPYNKAFA